MITPKKAFKILFVVLIGGVVGYFLLIGTLILRPVAQSYFNRTEFVSSKWKGALENENSIKINMIDDLLKKHELIGMSMMEIEDLLGRPPQTGYFKDYDFVYWLGPERGVFGIDSEWLGIKFHEGKVIKADILRD